ncbi:MAG: ParB/RepB/Spo0J family partition protein [Firmicutes bacterium]|jgi:ParB family chromosome partitioning protein|nr:ParB/RepB/Spo0J family partition protein [Bacillota bacterium]
MSERKALGRGLAAIIPQAAQDDSAETAIREIAVTRISPNAAQPRRHFSREQLEELAASMREHGVLEPVIVRPKGKDYELVVGERRWRAAQLAGLKVIPAIVRELEDREALELALVENLQREDLNPMEEAEAFRRLADEFGLTQEEIAARVGKRRSTVANRLRLLDLDGSLQDQVRQGRLSAGHARALLAVPDDDDRRQLAERVINEGLSVRAVEEIVRSRSQTQRKSSKKGRKSRAERPEGDPELADLVEDLQQKLSTRVRIVRREGRGQIEIEFYSEDDITRIYELIMGFST